MLDLLQLDRDRMVNQVLRQNWKKRTKIDPVLACRDGSTMHQISMAFLCCGIADLAVILALGFGSDGSFTVNSGALVCAAVASVLSLLAIVVKKTLEEKEAVAEFSEALQDLCLIWNLNHEQISRFGGKELGELASQSLCNQAAIIQSAEESSKDAAEARRDTFRRWHQLFRKFYLVGEKWDPFFKPMAETEKPDSLLTTEVVTVDGDSPDDLLGERGA